MVVSQSCSIVAHVKRGVACRQGRVAFQINSSYSPQSHRECAFHQVHTVTGFSYSALGLAYCLETVPCQGLRDPRKRRIISARAWHSLVGNTKAGKPGERAIDARSCRVKALNLEEDPRTRFELGTSMYLHNALQTPSSRYQHALCHRYPKTFHRPKSRLLKAVHAPCPLAPVYCLEKAQGCSLPWLACVATSSSGV